ncbi:hypothetical protein ABXZ88_003954 [Vibrio fluvialis]
MESPSTAAQLSSQLSKLNVGCTVFATNGHLFDYVVTPRGSYAISPINKQLVDTIRSLDGQRLVIATDCDRQGELIAKHIKHLTPNSTHDRCQFNDLSLSGVHRALDGLNKGEFKFQNRLADEAVMIKLINLRMKNNRVAGFYTTTTSIELAKQWQKHGSFDKAKSRAFEVNSAYYHCAMPEGQQLECVTLARPAVTKDIILQRTLTGRSLNTMAQLQESYLMGRLSYVRTDYDCLPVTASKTLQEYSLGGMDIQRSYLLAYNKHTPHYAIHNLAHPRSDVEILVALQNRSALTATHNDVLVGTTTSGAKILLNQNKQHVITDVRPEQQIAWLLAQSENSSPSNIEASATRYTKHFFNGGTRNDKLIGLTQELAQREYPTLWDNGLNSLVQTALSDAPEPISPSTNPIISKDIREYVHDISL